MSSTSNTTRLTVVNINLIPADLHAASVITTRQFAESGQTRRPHPDLESLIGVQVRVGESLVVLRVLLPPIHGRDDRPIRVILEAQRLVEFLVAVPRDARVLHLVRVLAALAGPVQRERRENRVVEHRVGDQAAGVVGFAVFAELQRVAIAAVDVLGGPLLAVQLRGVEGLYVAAVVLVEVRELVVEQDGRVQNIWNVELHLADRRGDVGVAAVADVLRLFAPSRCIVLADFIAERVGHGRRRDELEAAAVLGTCGRRLVAIRVVDRDLLDLGAGVEQQASDGREDDAHAEQQR